MVDHGGQRTGEMTGPHHSQEGCRQQQGAGLEGEQERQDQDPRECQWRETEREEHIVQLQGNRAPAHHLSRYRHRSTLGRAKGLWTTPPLARKRKRDRGVTQV